MATATKSRKAREAQPAKAQEKIVPMISQLAPINSAEGTALDPKVHTFKLEGAASITYTDADVALLEEAYSAQVTAEGKAQACSATLTRLFGRDWLDDGKGELYHKAVGQIRAWLWATLPACRAIRVRAENLKAAHGGTIPPGTDASQLAADKSAASSHLDRIVRAARKAQLMADQANSDGPLDAPAKRAKASTSKLLEDAAERLDKRGQGKSADADAAKLAGIVVNQCAKGRTELFLATMRCGARLQLSDEGMLSILRGMTGDEASAILARVKASEDAKGKQPAADALM